jgi:hypothetical protein
MNGATLELKVVAGADFFKSPCPVKVFCDGWPVKRGRARTLHTWAISHGFVFRHDDNMPHRGYYRHAYRNEYAAIL